MSEAGLKEDSQVVKRMLAQWESKDDGAAILRNFSWTNRVFLFTYGDTYGRSIKNLRTVIVANSEKDMDSYIESLRQEGIDVTVVDPDEADVRNCRESPAVVVPMKMEASEAA